MLPTTPLLLSPPQSVSREEHQLAQAGGAHAPWKPRAHHRFDRGFRHCMAQLLCAHGDSELPYDDLEHIAVAWSVVRKRRRALGLSVGGRRSLYV